MNKVDMLTKWIPFTKGIPKVPGLYLVTYENRLGLHTDAAVYDPNLNKWFWDEDEERAVTRKILAWQYLPEPYQANVDVNHKDIYYFITSRNLNE